ncbi:MAG: hypothetical protein HYX56_03475 [Chloroflexi bacterium]|nr:hypothetical protein [Chloroflexota bacterium]
MTASADFNYKVALAEGLKQLQAKRLRQAEEQFRYLVTKFPRADGGHRGLARVQLELGDRPAALATLRDAAAFLARNGDRRLAIDLLRDAVSLDPIDLASHRRLAAALALAGDSGGSADEFVRYARAQLAAGDGERARLEAEYAFETLGTRIHLEGLPDIPAAQMAADPAAAPAARSPETAVAARSTTSEIEEARGLLAAGKVQAASDLLLHCVAAGIAVHEAERELVAVARALGRDDLAAERERLLKDVLELGGGAGG